MNIPVRLLTIVACLFTTVNQALSQESQNHADVEPIRTAISEAIETVAKLHDAPAVSCCIVDGEEAFFINHGTFNRQTDRKVDEQSIYQIASLSKTFVGQVAHKLIRNGTLKLSDSIAGYLPESVDAATREKIQSVSILDLLTHRSGLPRDNLNPESQQKGTYVNYDYTEADLLEDLKTMELAFKPGDQFMYSNYGYSLLAYLCERASGKPYGQLVKEIVTTPLNMADTSFELDADQTKRLVTPYNHDDPSVAREPARLGKLGPPTSLYCTTADLAKMMKRQLAEYRQFEKTQSVTNLILTKHSKGAWSGSGIKYGFGFMDWGDGTFGHGGGMDGYGSEFTIDPKRNLGFILLTSSCETWTQRLASAALKAMHSGKTEVLNELIAVETIVAKFEQEGPQVGLETYQQLRERKPTPLNEETRVTLVTLAMHYGMTDAAKQFANDALNDFPDSERIKDLSETLPSK